MQCVGKPAHSRVAQEVVHLDPADGGVGLEVGELISQQKSRHGGLFSAAQTQEKGRGTTVVISASWMDPDRGGVNFCYVGGHRPTREEFFFFCKTTLLNNNLTNTLQAEKKNV